MVIYDMESLKKTQFELSELIGVSGFEKPVADYVYSKIENYVDELWIDPLGSLLAVMKGEPTKDRLLFDAHLDEVGFMVSYIEPKGGFLRFVQIGGWDPRILLGQSVKVIGKDGMTFHGITGSKPPHLTTAQERKSAVEISDMYMGAATEEAPTPKPPIKRKNKNIYQFVAKAEPAADMKYNTPIQKSVFFLPIRSDGNPPNKAPSTVPIRAIETVKPC